MFHSTSRTIQPTNHHRAAADDVAAQHDDTQGFDKETVAWFATGLGLGALGGVTAASFVVTSELLQKALPAKKG